MSTIPEGELYDSTRLTRTLLADGFSAEPKTDSIVRVYLGRGRLEALTTAVEMCTSEFILDARGSTVQIHLGDTHHPGLDAESRADDSGENTR